MFNSGDGSYDWTGSGSWGGNTWTESGSITPVLINGSGPVWGLNSIGSVRTLLFNPLYNQNDQLTINETSPTYSLCTLNLLDPVGNTLGRSVGRDGFKPLTSLFSCQDLFQPIGQLPDFYEVTSGTTPEAGGAGTYLAAISSVPEPSAWVMGLLGVLGVVGFACWPRKATAA